ncbi:MAG: SDR family oxidoreductase [Thermoanaerobaculia bacterium]
MGMEIDLSGKSILITGASRGIGREAAILLGRAGAYVAVNFLSREAAAQEVVTSIGAERAFAVKADVGNPSDCSNMVDEVVDRFGRIDVLVNNAAIFAYNPFYGGDYENWQRGWHRTFEVNVFGAANLVHLVLPLMRAQGGGKIINVASRAAFRGETEFADYGASKAALVNLTRSLARACAGDGIIATCVAPGFIETDMAQSELQNKRAELTAQVPTGRIGTAEEVANTILFLASPLSDYLAGATIDINGGSWFH